FVTMLTPSLASGIFFSSSRRRHTSSKRDWSSDVCSSDLRDGDHAYKLVKKMLSPVNNPDSDIEGASYPNMFDAHPPFQIDGNFGGAAGVAEMLVQSHIDNTIDILPALPSALSQGSIGGIRGQGGCELAMSWSGGKLQSLTVISKAGTTCSLRYAGKTTSFETKKGEDYQLDGDLNLL